MTLDEFGKRLPYAPIRMMYPKQKAVEMITRLRDRLAGYRQDEETTKAIKHWNDELSKCNS